MTEEFRRTGAEPAELGLLSASGPQRGERREGGALQPQKRIGGVESLKPRKRGGQPGNRNAWKTGWNSVECRHLRSSIWEHQRLTKALLRTINADLNDRTK